MADCDAQGNDFDRVFIVTTGAHSRTSDCLDCAIHPRVPTSAPRGSKVTGHGVEIDSVSFCGRDRAYHAGVAMSEGRA
jgi:hypothetical protein